MSGPGVLADVAALRACWHPVAFGHELAARQVENFTDFGHFPWVHPGLLGDPDRPVVPRHQVRTEGHVLHYAITRPEAAMRAGGLAAPAPSGVAAGSKPLLAARDRAPGAAGVGQPGRAQ